MCKWILIKTNIFNYLDGEVPQGNSNSINNGNSNTAYKLYQSIRRSNDIPNYHLLHHIKNIHIETGFVFWGKVRGLPSNMQS